MPFYVGKGRGNRATSHLRKKSVRDENPIKKSVIEKIEKLGLTPKVYIWRDNLLEEDAYSLEEELINRFGRRVDKSGILTNILICNRPPSKMGRAITQETKDKISAANKGKKRSAEISAKLSELRTGKKRGPHTPETIEKIRKNNLGKTKRKLTDEEKKKLSDLVKEQWKKPSRLMKHQIAFANRRNDN